ncbi:MAG: molybdate ABC transporter substrate-binding protein [Planctomycetota bacterium]|nr:MAG: molybdate ABC transporter substrate-binding protein [Planctomycetota bacterium]
MHRRPKRVRASLLLAALVAGSTGCGGGRPAESSVLTIYAAASTTNVVQSLAEEFERRSGVRVQCSFAGSSLLAQQIEHGARADVFLSAHPQWADELVRSERLDADTCFALLTNRLVLITPRDADLSSWAQAAAPHDACAILRRGNERVAIGDPAHVPAGQYARAALETLGCWEAVASRAVLAGDVRAALRFVERGEAALGIVYATDAAISDRVRVACVLPAETHPPIRYIVGRCCGAGAAADAFLAFLRSDAAREIIRTSGFEPAAN